MWIFDKLFNRKIEGKSSLDDLAENVVVNKETNTTEIGGNLNVNGTITQNGQPLGGGTKLYKHNLRDLNYEFTLITTNHQSIDFSVINDGEKMYNYLLTQNVIRFTDNSGNNIQYENVREKYFYSITIELSSSGLVPLINAFDDWDFTATTDTVTEL